MVKNRDQDEIMKGWIKYGSTRRKKMKGKNAIKLFTLGILRLQLIFTQGS